jgi:bla regulator protein BlaR1
VEPAISFVMGGKDAPVLVTAVVPRATDHLPEILFGLWVCGFAAILACWFRRWMRVRADVRAASRVPIDVEVPVVSSPALREPGVFGIFRPVLLLPEGIAERLSIEEWEAVLAHELCHVRCYDNLMAAIYMLAESTFWFHPLVWWIGKRLVAERERACDEEVLRLGSEPHVYAEGILKVCELYLESPLDCVAGVTGSNLRRRIRAIMTHRGTEKMSMGKRLFLTVAGMAALGVPVAVGMLNAPAIRAQSSPATTSRFEVASIKPNVSVRDHSSISFPPGGRFSATFETLDRIIINAYRIKDYQLSGGPSWLYSERFDIDARAEGNPSRVQMRSMVQSLLADRFHLAIHRETKDRAVYALVAGQGRTSLQKAPDRPTNGLEIGTGRLTGVGASMGEFSDQLSRMLDRPVIDKTGFVGLFDFKLEYSPVEARPDADAALPDIFSAIPEQLGLKLEATKAPVEVIVIDSVERPSEN